ncbi:hypothetical protein BJP08_06285 [Corynebacterium sp. NML140438]|uniref:hypothetical protein n=1 Tax=Corynebacterium sp. NML140438 TaxID=1906334 RepID=UPI0008FB6AA1|nr:hypothetical protein [Corynebacterium sp. NML140438]OIR41858.1 hypothetical protein BJP08_06285 [Corynebacterium sp. NML140438]
MKRNTVLAAVMTGALATTIVPMAQAQDVPLPAVTHDINGAEYFLTQDGTHYVPDRNLVNIAFDQLSAADRERAVDVAKAAAAGLIDAPSAPEATTPVEQPAPTGDHQDVPFTAEDIDPNNPAPAAAGLIALPAVLAIGGLTYYLNADGKTYVTDLARINEPPTDAEVKDSNALLAENAAEVARQGLATSKAAGQAPVEVQQQSAPVQAPAEVPVAEQRGIAAETGSNTLVRALFALVVASIIGAAVFAYGRRYLI